MKFDKTNLKDIRKDFDLAVKDFEKKYGVTVQMGNISFSDYQFTSKITVTSEEKCSEENERKEFSKYCRMYGLTEEDYGKTFRSGAKEYTIIGFELSRPKYCVKAKDKDGKVSLFSELALSQIKRQKSGLIQTDRFGNPI